ncbi:MAG: MFS transporter, partial [Luminiphilus sp.]|nr:MFS transporter [Luminiphilus sp.]
MAPIDSGCPAICPVRDTLLFFFEIEFVANSDAFTRDERQAVMMLSALYVVRMLGLFMVLPLIAIYATDMTGATPFLLGLAVGAYGLTQACLQIPMGWLSDLVDRRWVVAGGLLMLVLGSAVAATASTMAGIIIGRFLQG